MHAFVFIARMILHEAPTANSRNYQAQHPYYQEWHGNFKYGNIALQESIGTCQQEERRNNYGNYGKESDEHFFSLCWRMHPRHHKIDDDC